MPQYQPKLNNNLTFNASIPTKIKYNPTFSASIQIISKNNLIVVTLQVFKGFPKWASNLYCLKTISTTINCNSFSSLQVLNNPLDTKLENEPNKAETWTKPLLNIIVPRNVEDISFSQHKLKWAKQERTK